MSALPARGLQGRFPSRRRCHPRTDLRPAEGASGQQIHWSTNTFVDPQRLGLRSPGELPLVTIAYLIAQKLHACTDNTDPKRPNDRYRDLIDLILVDRLVREKDRVAVRVEQTGIGGNARVDRTQSKGMRLPRSS
jgi:hypothetical protein